MDSDQIGKVILIDDENRLLIMKSSDMNVQFAGEWDLPGGHIHIGEDAIDGLKREVKEETTLDITNPEKIYEEDRIKFYKTRQYRGTIEISGEHTEYKWVTVEELDSYVMGAKFVRAAKVALKTDDDSEKNNNI
jgi:8-oxo-dGTP diphosphatase|tara:strand:+ start:504 stop:905 length:402 start_codon:yes stop_codon:yes gene_type:complete